MSDGIERRTFIRRAAQVAGAAAAATGLASCRQEAQETAAQPVEPKPIAQSGTITTRVLGKTGVEVPILGFGGATLATKWGNALSTEDRVRLVRHAYDSGIRYYDTAISYTYEDSQAIIGEALKDVRDNVFITTKVDFWDLSKPDGRFTTVPKGEAARQVDMNLAELQSEYIDAIMIHGTPGVEQMTVKQCMEVHAELVKARDEGLARYVGFSAHHYFDKALELTATGGFDLCMLAYGYLPRGNSRLFSPLTTELRNACLAKAHELGMGIVAMKVIGAGMLSGFGEKEFEGLPGAAIRWAMQDDRVQVMAIGMRSPAEVDANIATLTGDTAYTNEDRALLAKAGAAVLNHEDVRKMSVE
ncbi:MAG: aldo/keto reductase [Armatimonadota bacterium]